MTEFNPLELEGVIEVRPRMFGDNRGAFWETYNRQLFTEAGISADFVQDNHSRSLLKGTLRGLHFQEKPAEQAKLVRVVSGAVFDVAIDVRPDSATYKKWVAVTLSAETGNQLFVPRGFAHGFLTLEENTEVVYKVDSHYSPENERSIRYDDAELGIEWPDIGCDFTLSAKDENAPNLREIIRKKGKN